MYKIVHRRLLIPDPEIVIIMYTLYVPLQTCQIKIFTKNSVLLSLLHCYNVIIIIIFYYEYVANLEDKTFCRIYR